jgi:hypothetical protein
MRLTLPSTALELQARVRREGTVNAVVANPVQRGDHRIDKKDISRRLIVAASFYMPARRPYSVDHRDGSQYTVVSVLVLGAGGVENWQYLATLDPGRFIGVESR